MKNPIFWQCVNRTFLAVFFFWILAAAAQNSETKFWDNVQFGGSLGATFGNTFTNIVVAPAGLYRFNEHVGLGVGLQGSYVKARDEYQSYMYGGSLIGIFSPVEAVQVSAELEQLRVNTELDYFGFEGVEDNFWNTALFIGLGYAAGPVTVGFRYNVLHRDDQRVYNTAYMPFIRVFF